MQITAIFNSRHSTAHMKKGKWEKDIVISNEDWQNMRKNHRITNSRTYGGSFPGRIESDSLSHLKR